MKLIVGLGNPGGKYEGTRHNAGFIAVDRLSKEFGFEPFKDSKKHKAIIAEGNIAGEKILLAKPKTFMNLSGESIESLVSFYKLLPEKELIVIYDDVAIDQGEFRIRAKGSAGGHNGIRSVIGILGTEDFTRVRIGIKPLHPFRGELEDYVLGKISAEEDIKLKVALAVLPAAIETYIKNGIEVAMNDYN